jgi:hypothetical protein
MEPWCSDCTGSNRRCSEPSSSTSRSPPINLPHTSRKIGSHPTITYHAILLMFLTACQFFNFYLLLMCNIIFICAWVGWQVHILLSTFVTHILSISHHARLWPMPCLMLYGSLFRGYASYARRLRSVPSKWIIIWMAHKRKLDNCLSYSEYWINFHIIYYPLYMLIM